MPPLPPASYLTKGLKDPPVWATVIGSRNVIFKAHSAIGHVKSALRLISIDYGPNKDLMVEEAWVYRAVNGEWVPWFYLPKGENINHHPLFGTTGDEALTLESDFVHHVQELV